MSNLPDKPIYLWPEMPRVTPDREGIQNQRILGIDNPALLPFWPLPKDACGASVLIFPGGGYERIAIEHEGYEIARWFNSLGVAAFVVKYRLHEYGFPAPLMDGLRALRVLRTQAPAWQLDSDRIGVVGFSAGGHLAASVATRFGFTSGQLKSDPYYRVSARPDFAVLAYPVITLEGLDAHAGSRRALLGVELDPQLVRENSLQYQVTSKVPPVFMVHGGGDKAVPVGNSLEFFSAVQKYNQHSELHIYQTRVHGFGLGTGEGRVSEWPRALAAWLKHNGIIPSNYAAPLNSPLI